MAFIHQDVVINQILTAAIYNQTEQNILDHIHGQSGVSSGIIGRVNSPVTVSNTTVETNLASITIPGGTLGSTKFLRYHAHGKYLINTAGNQTITMRTKYGGTVFASNARTDSPNASFTAWQLDGILFAAGATNSQRAYQFTKYAGSGQGVDADWSGTPALHFRVTSTPLAIDSTVNQTFLLTTQMDLADVNFRVVLEGFYIEDVER